MLVHLIRSLNMMEKNFLSNIRRSSEVLMGHTRDILYDLYGFSFLSLYLFLFLLFFPSYNDVDNMI